MSDKKDGIGRYLQDESNSSSKNIEGVFVPEGAADLSFFLKHSKKKFTIFGGGTGIAGGAVCDGGIIVSTEKFGRIKVNRAEKTVEAGAGVRLFSLRAELEKYGLWYPVDSTEQSATIGGNAAVNAWGTRSYKYGSIRDFTLGLGVVTASGDYFELKRGGIKASGLSMKFAGSAFKIADLARGRGIKNSAGYYMKKGMDILDLFIGSEGTLGVISDVKLRVLDRPADIHAFMIPVPGRQKAMDIIGKLKAAGYLKPLSIEFMDENSVKLLMEKFSFPGGRTCLVFAEFEDEKGIMDKAVDFINSMKIDPETVKTGSALKKEGFIYEIRESLPQQVNEIIRLNKMKKVSTDFSASDAGFPALMEAYDKALEKTKIKFVMFGHAGNNNLHINFLPENKAEYEEALDIYDRLAREAAGLGGSVSAEHGIGKLKKKYLKYMYSDAEIEAMKGVKRFFDPGNLCSPGNIFDL